MRSERTQIRPERRLALKDLSRENRVIPRGLLRFYGFTVAVQRQGQLLRQDRSDARESRSLA